jgi:hypothetical protein
MHPEQKRSYQKMTPEQKLKLLNNIQVSARKLKAAGLREQHPDWTEEEIRQKIRKIFLYARS